MKARLQRVAAAAKRYRLARDAFYQSIKEAYTGELSRVEIAQVAGISRQRVYQIAHMNLGRSENHNNDKEIPTGSA